MGRFLTHVSTTFLLGSTPESTRTTIPLDRKRWRKSFLRITIRISARCTKMATWLFRDSTLGAARVESRQQPLWSIKVRFGKVQNRIVSWRLYFRSLCFRMTICRENKNFIGLLLLHEYNARYVNCFGLKDAFDDNVTRAPINNAIVWAIWYLVMLCVSEMQQYHNRVWWEHSRYQHLTPIYCIFLHPRCWRSHDDRSGRRTPCLFDWIIVQN